MSELPIFMQAQIFENTNEKVFYILYIFFLYYNYYVQFRALKFAMQMRKTPRSANEAFACWNTLQGYRNH